MICDRCEARNDVIAVSLGWRRAGPSTAAINEVANAVNADLCVACRSEVVSQLKAFTAPLPKAEPSRR
jgi:hypothetical protein